MVFWLGSQPSSDSNHNSGGSALLPERRFPRQRLAGERQGQNQLI